VGPPPTCTSRGAGPSGPAGASQSCRGLPGNGRLGCAPRGAWSPAWLVRAGVLADGSTRASSRSSVRHPSGGSVAKGRKARGAAVRGHGQDAPFTRHPSRGAGWGWRLAHDALARRNVSRVAARWWYAQFVDCAYRRILGSRTQASESGSRPANAMAGFPAVYVVAGASSSPRASLRETEPGTVVERALKGKNPRRAPAGGFDLA
jgi:hypothetical protein